MYHKNQTTYAPYYTAISSKRQLATVKNVHSKCNNQTASPISYATVKDLLFQAERLQNSYEKLNVLSMATTLHMGLDCNELQQIKSVLASVIGEYPNDQDTINLLHPYGYHMSAYLQRRKELINLPKTTITYTKKSIAEFTTIYCS